MKDDSLVPSGLLLPQSMDVHCQATIYPLFNAASLCVSSKFSYSILQQSLKFRNASLLCTRPSVINCLGRSSPPPHPPLAAVIGGSFGREHLIGRENHGESSPSGCVQLRVDRSTLWLVCLIFNGVTWKRFNDPLHS